MDWRIKFGRPFEAHFPMIHYEDPAEGLEYMHPEGSKVLAMADGMVIRSGYEDPHSPHSGMGLRIKQLVSLPGFDSWTIIYGQLSDIKAYLGQKIMRGQEIGLSGQKTKIILKDRNHTARHIEFESESD